ncbi:DsbA family protein [Kocuria sp. M1R5S2]|uniref:DsbA family oxidoreductase n=1 Tax=Kocuria rhizosphaerae TaxID=3376285 RepID=UPI0037B3F509
MHGAGRPPATREPLRCCRGSCAERSRRPEAVQQSSDGGRPRSPPPRPRRNTTTHDDAAVDEDIAAARRLGVTGVPFYALDGRYGISGAQPTEVFARALEQAWADSGLEPTAAVAAPACGQEGCTT